MRAVNDELCVRNLKINKANKWMWIVPAVLVFLTTLRISYETGSFVFETENLTLWLVWGLVIGTVLSVATALEIKKNGVKRAANISVFLSVIAAGVLFGGGFYASTWANHLWSAAPPASFELIQGQYQIGFNFLFVFFNSLAEMIVILTLILNWRISKRRKVLIVVAVLYLTMRAWTYIYFVPNIIDFITAPTNEPFSPELKARADEWVYLSYYRTVVDGITFALLLSTAFIPFTANSKENTRKADK